jgi:hypothetical protein
LLELLSVSLSFKETGKPLTVISAGWFWMMPDLYLMLRH